jgi:MipA family protein
MIRRSYSLAAMAAGLLGACAGPRAWTASVPVTIALPQEPGSAGAALPLETASTAPPTAPSTSDALVPLPSVLDFTEGAGLGLALGIGVEYEGAYDGADEYEFGIEPAGAVQYRTGDSVFFWEGIEAGWRARVLDRSLVQLSARYEAGREASDSDDGRLDGLATKDDHIVGSIEWRQGLDRDWRNWVGCKALIGESDFGVLGVLAAGHRFGDARDGTGTEVVGYGSFGDAAFLNKDFGITDAEAQTSGLDAVRLSGGFRAAGVTLVHRWNVWSRLQAIAQANVEFYGDEVQRSAIARDDFEAEISLALVWRF